MFPLFDRNGSFVHVSSRLLCVEPLYAELTIVLGNQLNEVMWVAIISNVDIWFYIPQKTRDGWQVLFCEAQVVVLLHAARNQMAIW
jgi:hypothetical protein